MARAGTDRIPTIRAWSRRFGIGLTIVLFVLPIGMVVALAASRLIGGEVFVGPAHPVDLSMVPASTAAVIGGGALLSIGLYLVPLFFLRSLFALWAVGEILTRAAAQAIRHAGVALFAASIAASIIAPVVEFVASDGAAGLSYGIDLISILPAGVIYVVGLVLDEAARVAEDAELTI